MELRAGGRIKEFCIESLNTLLCTIGIHDPGSERVGPIHHMGEYPYQRWQHICTMKIRTCKKCGFDKCKPVRAGYCRVTKHLPPLEK